MKKNHLIPLLISILFSDIAYAEITLTPYAPTNSIHDIRQIEATEDGELVVITQKGELWKTQQTDSQLLLNNASSDIAPKADYGRIALSDNKGNFLLWTKDRIYSSQIPMAENAGMIGLAFATIGVVKEGNIHKLARIETQGDQAVITATSNQAVLPDAHPIQINLTAKDEKQGHIAVLASPDSERYQHAALGDQWEATDLLYLERHSLTPLATMLNLKEGFVFEANQLASLYQNGKNLLVTTISGGGMGAKAAIIGIENDALTLLAESQPLPSHRWQSPFHFGETLYAVQMPHLVGKLVEYQQEGKILQEKIIGQGFSNHQYGKYETDLTAKTEQFAVIPHYGYKQVSIMDKQGKLRPLETQLPAPIEKTRADNQRVYLLLKNGQVWVVEDK
ncbi:hypothetical protein BKK54_02935 [Rodentibacter genomosp. 1]|uniref:Uncharacterized protein n=1 Tax=Rodentibacter genomosp. 1 TaxID=1908264 RepID=A0A1V3J972_9PAST|nr:hypothetical protein [Rodentibacter genomosp. 1]OOF51576.1 hypothetical protein BKK54_02935 [Rodentibacter genomosp. 1]